MDINEFIDTYVSMILGPAVGGRGRIGFRLSNGMRIFFRNTHINKQQASRLSKHYWKEGIN